MNKTPEYITEGEGFVDIALSRPFDMQGTKVTSIRMREPTVADQLAADGKGSDAAREIAMMANLAEISPEDIKRLPLKDYKRLQTGFMVFID
jgi:hypothetical protein